MTAAPVAPAPPTPAAPEAVDRLDQFDQYAALVAPPEPRPPGALDAVLAARVREVEEQAAAIARHAVTPLRRGVPEVLRRAAAPLEPALTALEQQLAALDAAPDAGSLAAQGARYLVRRQHDDQRARLRAAVEAAAEEAREQVAALMERQRELVARDGDPVPLAPADGALLDDVAAFGSTLSAGERLELFESTVRAVARAAPTASGRALVRHLARVARTWLAEDPAFDPAGSATADRSARLARLRWVLERVGRDPRVEGARRALVYAELAEIELGAFARALVDQHGDGTGRTDARMVLQGLQLLQP